MCRTAIHVFFISIFFVFFFASFLSLFFPLTTLYVMNDFGLLQRELRGQVRNNNG